MPSHTQIWHDVANRQVAIRIRGVAASGHRTAVLDPGAEIHGNCSGSVPSQLQAYTFGNDPRTYGVRWIFYEMEGKPDPHTPPAFRRVAKTVQGVCG
jgi:hypothetical protein